MRTRLKLFAVITMVGLASVGLYQPAPKYSLSVSLREITVKAGTPVVLDITTQKRQRPGNYGRNNCWECGIGFRHYPHDSDVIKSDYVGFTITN